MTERITARAGDEPREPAGLSAGSPADVSAPPEGEAARDRMGRAGQAGQDALASLRPPVGGALKSAIALPSDIPDPSQGRPHINAARDTAERVPQHSEPGRGSPADARAGEYNKPGFRGKVVDAIKIAAVAGVIGISSWMPGDQPRHNLADGGQDRSELTAKAGHGAAADTTADNCPPSTGNAAVPAADRLVAEVSAPVPEQNDDASKGGGPEELKKDIDELITSLVEDKEKKEEESRVDVIRTKPGLIE